MIVRFGDFELDVARRTLRRQGRPVEVQPRVLGLLAHLACAADRVVSRNELRRTVWAGITVSEPAFRFAIKEARRALGDDGRRQRWIETVRGRGFRFVGPVTEAIATEAGGDPFVGRRETMASLEATLETVREEGGRLVLLEGEPGIGKSRILGELAAVARRRAFRVLIARGAEGFEAPAYWPWSQLLRQLLEAPQREELPHDAASVIAQLMPELRELLPEATGPPPSGGGDARETRFRLFEALARSGAFLARHQPLLLGFDDLHRADPATLSLLDFVARDPERLPVLVVGAFRGAAFADEPLRARLLGQLLRVPRALHFSLSGLERGEVRCLVEALRGATPEEPQLDELMESTHGNPFFVREVSHLAEPWRGAVRDLPSSVQQAVLRHLDALPATCRELLTRAAVLGRCFELEVLTPLAGRSRERVCAVLDDAVAARVVEPTDAALSSYQFRHALIPEALCGVLPAAALRQLHADAARALDCQEPRGSDHALRKARHLVRAFPAVGGDVAVLACREAAAQARERCAHEEVVSLLEQAVELAPASFTDPSAELELLLELADSQRVATRLADARLTCTRAAKLARRLGDAESLARAALGFAGEHDDPRSDPVVVGVLEEAMRVLGPGQSPLHVHLQSRMAEAVCYGPEMGRAEALSGNALRAARLASDPRTLGRALEARHWSTWTPDNLDERDAIAEELLEAGAHAESCELEHAALSFGISNALERGDRARVEAACAAYERLAARGRRLLFDWHVEHHRVMRLLLEGDTDGAEAALDHAARLGRQTRYQVAATWHGIQLFGLRYQQGRMSEVAPVLQRMDEEFPLAPWKLAREVFASGRREGRIALRSFLGPSLERVRRDFTFLTVLWVVAPLCARLRAAEEAQLVEAALEPFADRHVVVGSGILYAGPVAETLGLLALAQEDEGKARLRFAEARARDLRPVGERSDPADPRRGSTKLR